MDALMSHLGLALMFIGAILLTICYFANWESNAELLIGLMLILLGYFLHVWLQKRREKY